MVMQTEHALYPVDLEKYRQAIPTTALEQAELDTITEVAEQLHRMRANGYTPAMVLRDLGIYRRYAASYEVTWPQAAYELAKWALR